ncbi:MAG: hypothetical protein QMD43_05540 [Thermodesulfovibrio sp.]|nr:hypothetical protein [Thermodesulfovibrio sp.]
MKIKKFLIILSISFFSLFFITFAQSQSDIEQKLRQIEQQMQDNTNLNDIMQKYKEVIDIIDKVNIEESGFTGMQNISTKPADTPEKEIKRRREIINNQYKNAKYLLDKHSPQENQNPQIAEAIAVEGYILVNGGEREIWYNNQLKTDILYNIKETFTGNLIVFHTYNIKKGKFENEKDYEIDSISTDIKLQTLAGRTCTKWSPGTPTVCLSYANFINYEIDRGEYFPNFYAGVVNITSDEIGHLKIEANTPKITFYAIDGINKIGAQTGCFGAEWTISKKEFENLIKNGTLILKKDIGKKSQATPGCMIGSTMMLYIKIKREGPEECKNIKNIKIEIIKPANKNKYLYSDDGDTGRLILELEAKVTPTKYENLIEWEIPEMEGSYRIIQPSSGSSNPKGPRTEVMYKGLPPNVEAFGRQKVKARIKIDGCTLEDTKEVMIFYPRDAKNNPEGKYPNWFYYWKQTPSAIPFGQNVNIEFGGTEFDLCTGEHVMAIFKPDYLFKTIHVCNLTEKADKDFKITIPLVNRNVPSTLTEKKLVTYTHIDTFAVIIMHEFTHFNHYHTWWRGKTPQKISQEDKDGDGVPDRLESAMGFDPAKFQTYWGDDEDFKNINGDEEFLAYESTYDYPIGKYDNYDWGKPGKNWND